MVKHTAGGALHVLAAVDNIFIVAGNIAIVVQQRGHAMGKEVQMAKYAHERAVRRVEVGDFTPAPIEDLRVRQLRRLLISQLLDASKAHINTRTKQTLDKKQDTFVVRYDGDLGGGVFTEARTRDLVRLWVWETYQGSLGLEKCLVVSGETHISLRVK